MKRIIILTAITIQLFTAEASLWAQAPINLGDEKAKADSALSDVFKNLKIPEILGSEETLKKEIARQFDGKEKQAIEAAINNLRSSRFQIVNGKKSDRSIDLIVAKKIFQQYPQESLELLKKEYNSGNAVIRGNIIEAVGKMDNETEVKALLMKALNDQTPSELPDLEMMEAVTLRVCDKAYNQIVLRYEIKDVLRTISNMHSVETRDYHINILKQKF